MNHARYAGVVLLVAATTNLVAQEPRGSDEFVRWTPTRNVKDAITEEIARFEKDLKTRLGPQALAFQPYVAEQGNPHAAALEAVTVEQILDQHLKAMRKLADHDNQDFLPQFVAFRRTPAGGGSDLLQAPSGGLTRLAQHAGNVTFRWEWETVAGGFQNHGDHNDVDEVYELQLNGTLTLGVFLALKNDHKQTVISHSVTKPLVQGWRVSLVASEGKAEPVLNP